MTNDVESQIEDPTGDVAHLVRLAEDAADLIERDYGAEPYTVLIEDGEKMATELRKVVKRLKGRL